MLEQVALIFGFVCAFVAALLFASKNGSKAAQLESLKAEMKKQAEEQKRAKQITDSVIVMDQHTVRQRLHEIANRHQQ